MTCRPWQGSRCETGSPGGGMLEGPQGTSAMLVGPCEHRSVDRGYRRGKGLAGIQPPPLRVCREHYFTPDGF